MHPNHEHMTKAAEDPERAFERRFEIARQSGVPADALAAYKEARGGAQVRHRRDRDAGPRPGAGRGGRDGPRQLAGVRDARARAVARGAPPARARAAAVGRPPARPRLALLRLRLLAGPGGRVPVEPRRGGRARRAARARRPRPSGARRARAHRGEQARDRASASSASEPRSPTVRAQPSTSSPRCSTWSCRDR